MVTPGILYGRVCCSLGKVIVYSRNLSTHSKLLRNDETPQMRDWDGVKSQCRTLFCFLNKALNNKATLVYLLFWN
uniref:Uncharacterized protein n=1 Tax=Ulva flexuosa TaxID=83791 RepID=A0A3S6P7F7_9CHLO|nr:hypothetical protein [Ulva flexuosa]